MKNSSSTSCSCATSARPENLDIHRAYHSDLEFVAGGHSLDTCNGDSGGPAYINSGADFKVAGLTSRATADAVENCGDGGIYTRLDKQLDFVKAVASAAHLRKF